MNLHIEDQLINENKYFLKVSGEIDAYTAPKLKEKLLPLTEQTGITIVMDLEQTEYMDSTGLGIIIAGYKSAYKNESYIQIQGMTPRVRRLFEITGVSDLLMDQQSLKEGQK